MLIEKPIRASPGAIFRTCSSSLRKARSSAIPNTWRRKPDVGAAKRLAADLISAEAVASVARLVAGRDAMLLPVHALEAGGVNRIPAAMAELLGERMGLEVEERIVQANTVGHTGASGWGRLARPAVFNGEVASEGNYVLVDDFVGQGGTLANLRGYAFSFRGAEAQWRSCGKQSARPILPNLPCPHRPCTLLETAMEKNLSVVRLQFRHGLQLTESEVPLPSSSRRECSHHPRSHGSSAI